MVRIQFRWQACARIRENHQKTIATEAQKQRRLELEKTLAGMPVGKRENRIDSVADVAKTYEQRYALDHRGREQSILFSKGRLAHVKRLLGTALLPDLTENAVRGYINTRIEEGANGRTVNMEVRELSRAVGKPWSVLWPKVRKQEERKDVARRYRWTRKSGSLRLPARRIARSWAKP